MSRYEPGTVAMVTAYNRPTPYRAFFDGQTWREHGAASFCVDSPTDVRPLVVLDPHEANPSASTDLVLRNLVELLRADEMHLSSDAFADQIEAQTKPPRIPEPGLWGVVKSRGDRYVRHTTDLGQYQWSRVGGDGLAIKWDELIDPILVREGVTE